MFIKCVSTKGETVWINADMIFYITPYKGHYRIFFEDGMSCDVSSFTEVTLEEFLRSLSEK